MTYQSKHAQRAGLGPPCPSSKKPGLWRWVGEGKGLPDFPNTVAPGLGDHPLDISRLKLRVRWGRKEGPTSQHLEPGALLGRRELVPPFERGSFVCGDKKPWGLPQSGRGCRKGGRLLPPNDGLPSLAPQGEAGALL